MGFACCCGQPTDPADCPFIHRLQNDLMKRVWWTGNCFCDYMFFICQQHPLLGIVLCHPNHPMTKLNRFCIFALCTACTIVPAASIAGSHDEMAEATQSANITDLFCN